MALYSLSVSIVSRSQGRSSVAVAAYWSGQQLHDRRTGRFHDDHSTAQRVEHREITAPAEAPSWALDRESLWNAVESRETRKDAQLARAFLVALPHELPILAWRQLLREWIASQLVSLRMVADWVIRAPVAEGDSRNYHAHIMATTRPVDANGFTAMKDRGWNKRQRVLEWRTTWADRCNRALELAGRPERVDHRSLADQLEEALKNGDVLGATSLRRSPQRHLGKARVALLRKGRASLEDFDFEGLPGKGNPGPG